MHPEHAQALFALSTSHEAWRELLHSYELGWGEAEAWLTAALAQALLQHVPERNHAALPAGKRARRQLPK